MKDSESQGSRFSSKGFGPGSAEVAPLAVKSPVICRFKKTQSQLSVKMKMAALIPQCDIP